jgi:hypothetical protein
MEEGQANRSPSFFVMILIWHTYCRFTILISFVLVNKYVILTQNK